MRLLRTIARRLGPRRSVLLAVAIIAGPTLQAWWELFFEGPLVPTLIDKVGEGNVTLGQLLVVIVPMFAVLVVGVLLYSASKPTQPFVPNRGETTQQFGEITAFTLRISNGVPDIFHRCYGKIIEFVRVSGGPISNADLPKRGDRLMWNAYKELRRESVTITSLSSEELLIAEFDKRQPSSFQIPIGSNTVRSLQRSGSYQVTVEVGSEQSAATPSIFEFTISATEEGISINQIDLVAP